MSELAPCPYCGAHDWQQHEVIYWQILKHCKGCFFSDDTILAPVEFEYWNHRPELHTEPPEDENQCVLNWILDYPDRKWGGFWLAEKYSYAKAVYEDRYSGWLPLPPEPEGRE